MDDHYSDLFAVYAPLALAVVALVFAAYAFIVVRFRDRGGSPGPLRGRDRREGIEMRESQDRLGWELAYVAGLALVAGALIAISLLALSDSEALADDPGQVVEVTAFQWGWAFAYPDAGVEVVGQAPERPELVVPADTTVRFRVVSRDVIHSFWIPSERFKRDVFPDVVSRFDLVFEDVGTFDGECAEFCGLRHHAMGFRVRVLAPEAFERWRDAAAARGAAGSGGVG